MAKPTRETVQLETKSLPIITKEIREDRIVKSYFAVMGQKDSVNDIIRNGAFSKTIQENSDRIRVLWQHNPQDPPVGVPVSLQEIGYSELATDFRMRFPDATGALLGEIKYLNTSRGDEILIGIKEGAIKENSIGFDVVPGKMKLEQGTDGGVIRMISEARLWDLSPVNWGAQSAALNVKSVLDGGVGELVTIGSMLENILSVQMEGYEFRNLFEGVVLDEIKAGRVLSSRNLTRLKDALSVLEEILLAAEPPEPEEEPKALTPDFLKANLFQRLEIAARELALLGV